jgi:hypothetical protein
MAKSLKNLIAPTPLWAAEITDRLKRLEDLVAFLGGAVFVFDNSTTEADPGPGRFRLDNTVKALSTSAFVSNITEGGIDIDDIYDGVDPGDQMIFVQESDPSRNLHTTVTSVTDNGTWHKFEYTVDASNGAEFQNNRSCSISIIRN